MRIGAKYEGGVFKPLEGVTINEGTIVEVRVPSYADRLKTKSRSVRDFAFYGMWKDPPTSAIVSSTSTLFGVIFEAERHPLEF
jgi:predicted DNA-binding antitoxin AbrB/MazE fold protein